MRRKIALLLLIPTLLASLSGCWSRRELNDIAIAVALGIDKAGHNYQVTVQIVNPGEVASKKGGGGLGAPTTVYTESGETVLEALRSMTTKSPRKIYLAHLRMLVIGEELANEGIDKHLDFFSRDPEVRTDFYMAVAEGVSAEKILRVYTIPQEVIPANKMFKSLETADKYYAGAVTVTLHNFMTDTEREGRQPVLTRIVLTGEKDAQEVETKENVEKMKPISSLNFNGLAVFKEGKFAGWLNREESKGYNYIQGQVKSTVRSVSCPSDGKLVLETIRTVTKVKGKVVNGRPEIEMKVRTEDNVAGVECDIDLLKESTILELEEKEELKIKEDIENTIRKVQEKYKSDIFGFGEAIHRSNPEMWNLLKKDWDDREFPDLKVHTEVDVKIHRLGTTTQPPRNLREE